MGKLIPLILILSYSLHANSYQTNCIPCHTGVEVGLDKLFYRYLLKYSSEKNLKNSLKNYLQNPHQDSTVMPEAFILRYGIKEKTTLNDKELQEAMDIYWEKYKVFGKLK